MLYAFSSGTGNNGSAFAGLTANTPWYNTTLGLAMLIGRFLMIIPIMALAGSLVQKKISPPSNGTFPVAGGTFVLLLLGTILLVGALNFLPALTLGTITLGNRVATAFLPAPKVKLERLADAAQLASLADETPEGRSIVVLAKQQFKLRAPEVAEPHARFVPFIAQTRMSGFPGARRPARSFHSQRGGGSHPCLRGSIMRNTAERNQPGR